MNDRNGVVHVSAPVRLDLAGAWTDVAPFATHERGVVVNVAIDLRTHVELRPIERGYQLVADDLDEQVTASSIDELARDDALPLVKAAVRRYRPEPCSLRTWAEAPPGSGLGTSGAMSVALVAALAKTHQQKSRREIALEAWQLETVDAAVAGGQQDQLAAALAGFQYLTFDRGTTTARPIDVDAGFAAELERHIVVCHTGRSRFSGSTITRVMQSYRAGDATVCTALRALVDIAEAMHAALVAADLTAIGKLLDENWRQQQLLAPGMQTDEMARLEEAMRAAGAIGGKAAGSGAGGSMFFVVPGDVERAAAAARLAGSSVLPVRLTDRGVGRA